MFNIANPPKFVVIFNFIKMSKPEYIVILMGLFCSVVAGGTLHFYSFFSVNILARVDFFGMTTLAFALASQAQAKS